MEAATFRGLQRFSMAPTEDPKVFLESSDIVLSLVKDPHWYLKIDEISPTLIKCVIVSDLMNANFYAWLGEKYVSIRTFSTGLQI